MPIYLLYFAAMLSINHKAKQYLTLTAKLLIVSAAFYFIYTRVAGSAQTDWQRFIAIITDKKPFGLIALILLCTFLNRFIEILKWQNLAQAIKPISLAQATEQVMAALTVSIFTPNGVGEYAAKALYSNKDQAKKVIFLNLVCNGAQLIIAVVAGIAGFIIFNALYGIVPTSVMLSILGGLLAATALLLSVRKITIKGYSLQTLAASINQVPKAVHYKNMLLAIARYTAIIHQQYFIFLTLGVTVSYPVLICAIAAVYFLGSSLPNFQFMDFAVKGSVGVLFMGLLGINDWITLFTATLVWLLNIVIPVAIGSYYVFRFKSVRVTSQN